MSPFKSTGHGVVESPRAIFEAPCDRLAPGADPGALPAELGELIRRTAIRLTNRRGTDHRDAEQAAWERIIHEWKARRYDPARGTISSWARSVARSAIQDLVRRELKYRGLFDANDSEVTLSRLTYEDPRPDEDEARDRVERLLKALRKRSTEATYQALTSHWLQGETDDRIATSLGTTAGNVRVLRSRGMKALKELGRDFDAAGTQYASRGDLIQP